MMDDTHAAWVYRLTHTEQARLRFSLMRELSWIEWDYEPEWWWDKTHGALLEVKWACGRPRTREEPQP
jgi:hypothetical protein